MIGSALVCLSCVCNGFSTNYCHSCGHYSYDCPRFETVYLLSCSNNCVCVTFDLETAIQEAKRHSCLVVPYTRSNVTMFQKDKTKKKTIIGVK